MDLKRNILFVAFLLIAGLIVNAQQSGPRLSFEKERHDYGTISLDDLSPGEKFDLTISFTNTGNAPLVLSNVRACCGTSVSDWPQEPIMPGEGGIIEVNFRLRHRAQRISRTVTVLSNCSEQASAVFRIAGEVVESDNDGFIQNRD